MNRLTTLALSALLATGIACTSAADPLPEGSDEFPTETTVPTVPKTPEPQASTCDVAREAFLTGTQEQINASLRALVADKGADATAREYAQQYLSELTKDYSWAGADAEMLRQSSLESSASLIRMGCSF